MLTEHTEALPDPERDDAGAEHDGREDRALIGDQHPRPTAGAFSRSTSRATAFGSERNTERERESRALAPRRRPRALDSGDGAPCEGRGASRYERDAAPGHRYRRASSASRRAT